MKDDFSFKRDYKKIMWKQTAYLNFLRSFFAGLVWMVIMFFDKGSNAFALFLFPVIYFGFFLPLGLVAHFLTSIGVPIVWIYIVVSAITIIPGDPFVYIVHKIKPQLVPVEQFSFINFKLIIFVLNQENDKNGLSDS